MAFTSGAFAAFVLAALTVYYLAPGRFRWMVLLIASGGFYWCCGIWAMSCLLFTTLTTYLAGLVLGTLNTKREALTRTDQEAHRRLKRRKQLVVLLTLLVNFGLLYAVKYGADAAGRLGLPWPGLVLPLGLSFFMFQAVGYVIDCYRGSQPPERNPAKYALFVSFFPQLVQGPISRFRDLGPQLIAGRAFSADNVKYGLQLALWGYFKKLVISDRAGVAADAVFGSFDQYHGVMLAAGVLFYSIQLYCDFSGGIDITRGVAKMFGIDLAENFRRPLFATSLADYWRRWHITLGQWMRDYVFYPLSLSKPFARLGRWSRRHVGGKLGKLIPTSLATFIVYLLIGVWHGSGLRYVAFGLWNGTLITLSVLLEGPFHTARTRLGIQRDCLPWRVFQTVRTALLVFIGRYLTRAPRLLAALWMLKWTVADPQLSALWDGRLLGLGLTAADILVVFSGLAAVLLAEGCQERGGQVRVWLERRHWLVQWAAIMLALGTILLLGIMRGDYISPAFIYQQF